jgi:ubiquitin C-terminal hydrolase
MHQGLVNVGNTCSINTLIQCLGHCPTFLDTILNRSIIATKRPNHEFSIYDELKEVFVYLWVKNHTIIPQRFISAFYESIGDSYVRGDQFDLTEMWMLLLNNIIEETHLSTHRSMHQDVIDRKSVV